jgi:hypothetical protein
MGWDECAGVSVGGGSGSPLNLRWSHAMECRLSVLDPTEGVARNGARDDRRGRMPGLVLHCPPFQRVDATKGGNHLL